MALFVSTLSRAALSGVFFGFLAFCAGVVLNGALLSESDAESWGENLIYASTIAVGGIAALALARRRGESPGSQAVALAVGTVAAGALLLVFFGVMDHGATPDGFN